MPMRVFFRARDRAAKTKKPAANATGSSGPKTKYYPGDVLLSHTVARAVPSALRGLTAVFGMGTGVALSLWTPGKIETE